MTWEQFVIGLLMALMITAQIFGAWREYRSGEQGLGRNLTLHLACGIVAFWGLFAFVLHRGGFW